MKKTLVTVLLVTIAFCAQSQKYFTRNGVIRFTAGTALEDIDAINRSVNAAFDPATGEIEFSLLVKGFEFRRGLMQEHFNENYMESEKLPKATFKGKSEELSKIDFKKDGNFPLNVKGILEIHGVKHEVQVIATVIIEKGIVTTKSKFNVEVADYGIKIPGAVKDKIATTVAIDVECSKYNQLQP